MQRQYDLKRIELAAGVIGFGPFAVNPGHEKGLIFLPATWDGGLTLTYELDTKDFRIQHLSHTGADGEVSEPQLQVPPGLILNQLGNAVDTVAVAGGWCEIPLVAMIAPRLSVVHTITTLAHTVWVATKA